MLWFAVEDEKEQEEEEVQENKKLEESPEVEFSPEPEGKMIQSLIFHICDIYIYLCSSVFY